MKLDELRKRLEAPSDAEAPKMEGPKPRPEPIPPWQQIGFHVVSSLGVDVEALKSAARCERCGHMRKVTPDLGSDVYVIEPCEACFR